LLCVLVVLGLNATLKFIRPSSSSIYPPRQRDACQLGLEHLDGRRHDETEGRLFHIRMVAGKKLCLKASTDPTGMQNLLLCPLVLCVFGVR